MQVKMQMQNNWQRANSNWWQKWKLIEIETLCISCVGIPNCNGQQQRKYLKLARETQIIAVQNVKCWRQRAGPANSGETLSQNARVHRATPPPCPAPHTLNQIWCQAVTGARNLVATITITTKCSADVALARCVIVWAFFLSLCLQPALSLFIWVDVSCTLFLRWWTIN